METDWFELLCVMHFDVSSTHFLICFHSVRMVTALSTETFTKFQVTFQQPFFLSLLLFRGVLLFILNVEFPWVFCSITLLRPNT